MCCDGKSMVSAPEARDKFFDHQTDLALNDSLACCLQSNSHKIRSDV